MCSTPCDATGTILDARELDGEPVGGILNTREGLTAAEALGLRKSFEPEPLYAVLEQRGFEHEAANPAPGEWHVKITKA